MLLSAVCHVMIRLSSRNHEKIKCSLNVIIQGYNKYSPSFPPSTKALQTLRHEQPSPGGQRYFQHVSKPSPRGRRDFRHMSKPSPRGRRDFRHVSKPSPRGSAGLPTRVGTVPKGSATLAAKYKTAAFQRLYSIRYLFLPVNYALVP